MPTENQKRMARVANEVIDKNLGKSGKISVSRIMKEAKYSKSYSKNPQQLTNTKAWKEIMAENFPDEFMGKKHRQLFDKQETIAKNNNKTGKIEVIKTGEIDVNAVKAALDMGYKLTGKYVAPDQNVLVETLEQRLKRKKLENG